MDRDEEIDRLRGRVAWCRRLAQAVTTTSAAEALNKMADEIQADIDDLLTEHGQP